MVRRFRAGGQTDRRRTARLRHVCEATKVVVALDGDRGAMERLDRPLGVGEGDERMERPDLRSGGHRRHEGLRAECAARVDHRLTAVHPEGAGQRRDDVVGDGEDDQLHLVQHGVRLGEDPAAVDEPTEPLPPAGIPTGHGVDRPAATRQGDAEGRANGTGAIVAV